jgi:hypothetical protein
MSVGNKEERKDVNDTILLASEWVPLFGVKVKHSRYRAGVAQSVPGS